MTDANHTDTDTAAALQPGPAAPIYAGIAYRRRRLGGVDRPASYAEHARESAAAAAACRHHIERGVHETIFGDARRGDQHLAAAAACCQQAVHAGPGDYVFPLRRGLPRLVLERVSLNRLRVQEPNGATRIAGADEFR
jgi:hypothetical protein